MEENETKNLLEVENLQTFFPVRSGFLLKTTNYVRAVNDVSFQIKKGEVFSIVGESGCGKSTLAKTIAGLIKPNGGHITFNLNKRLENKDSTKRKSSFSAKDWGEFIRQHRKDLQIIFQNPHTSLNPRHTVFEILKEPLIIHKIVERKQYKEEVARLLEKVGLSSNYMNRYPHSFSGGQRQRIAIARAIASNPKLLICDEITSALDVSVQAQIINLLMDIKDELGLSILFISHDLSLVRVISDMISVMYLGSFVEVADAVSLFEAPAHPYTKALLDSIPSLNPHKKTFLLEGEVPSPVDLPTGCIFHTRCPVVQNDCKIKKPDEIVLNHKRRVRCLYPLN